MSDSITLERQDAVHVIRMDDGKANALSFDLLSGVSSAIDAAEQEGGAIALLGRPGRFSAGFDLSVMGKGDPAAIEQLVGAGAKLVLRMLQSPMPIVIGCTGHALAMGAVLLLGADLRIGASGAFKLGLNEVSIRLILPRFAVRLAEDRLSKRHLLRAANQSEIYTPESACDAGFLDHVVPEEALFQQTIEAATRLAALPRSSFAGTKASLRGPVANEIATGLSENSSEWLFGRS